MSLNFHMGDHSDSTTSRNMTNVDRSERIHRLIRYTRLLFSVVLLLSIVACKKIYVPIWKLEELSDISPWILHHLNLPRNPAEPTSSFLFDWSAGRVGVSENVSVRHSIEG